jgi:hypothetical protein
MQLSDDQRMIDAPTKKFVISIRLRRCLNAGIDGARRRLGLDGIEFHASTVMQKNLITEQWMLWVVKANEANLIWMILWACICYRHHLA